MIHLESDYCNGAHPEVLRRLIETNDAYTDSYGFDAFSEHARALIREACGTPEADIYFISGGTQTNALVISSILGLSEGVVAVSTGHINCHESGAIEYTGHKVITLPHHDGKMDPSELTGLLDAYNQDESREHCVAPGMVYITLPTEYGTLYTAAELEAIHNVCRKYDLPLYVDGARLGYALASPSNDITLPFLAAHCDAFYIGGTKVGALCGEALVFPLGKMRKRQFSIIKQHGALLAKSRLCGVQFEALFTDGLYFNIGKHAIEMAEKYKSLFLSMGYRQYIDSPTNQLFFIIPDDDIPRLREQYGFEIWGPHDSHTSICRFVTSWATPE